jgi:1-acyl-sn-glycerol-3-phosphate acyltransferase
LLQAKSGFLLLARMTDVPIVPIALQGTKDLLPINDDNMGEEELNRADIRVSVGQPFRLPDKNSFGKDVDWKEACTTYAMSRIAEMLPEAYRGEYK